LFNAAIVTLASVGRWEQDTELLAERAEVVTAGGGHQHSGEFVGVNHFVVLQDAALLQKTQIETDVMSYNWSVTDKGFKVFSNFLKLGRIANFHVADACQPRDKFWDMPARIDHGRPFRFHAMTFELHRPDFDDGVTVLAETRRFDVYGYY